MELEKFQCQDQVQPVLEFLKTNLIAICVEENSRAKARVVDRIHANKIYLDLVNT